MRNLRSSRSGQVNSTVLVVGGIAAVVVIGVIIGIVVHQHNKEKARTSSQAHIAACKQLEVQIAQAKSPLAGAGLNFQPYQSRFDAAARLEKQAEAVVERDPVQADKIAGDAETQFKGVLADVQLAVQVKTDHSGSDTLDSASRHVAQVRSESVSWNYPGTPSSRSERYRLEEQGQNPDTHLGASRRLLGSIDASLNAGNPQEAQRILQEAKSEAAAAERCISNTMDAKSSVETKMGALQQKTESSDSQFTSAVEKAYFNQEFVGAASRMESLRKLIDDRQETRELLSFCQRLSRDVAKIVEDNSEYTSYSTDQKFQTLKDQLNALADAVKQSNANWTDLKATAQRLEKGLNGVKDEAAQAHKDYDDAVFAVKSFRKDYEQADRNGLPPLTFWSQAQHPDITDTVKDKVKDVNSLQTKVERQIKQSKQDWKQIKSDAEAGSQQLTDLRTMVEEDNKKLDQLVAAKDALKQVTNYNRYSCNLNGRLYSGADESRRDRDFASHWDKATDRYDVALRAWKAREKVGFEDALRGCKQELTTLNNIGWYNMLRVMRTSSDRVAQKVAWDNGFRDDKSVTEWTDGFVSKRAAGTDGLWTPDTRFPSGGSADFGPPLDFKAPWGN